MFNSANTLPHTHTHLHPTLQLHCKPLYLKCFFVLFKNTQQQGHAGFSWFRVNKQSLNGRSSFMAMMMIFVFKSYMFHLEWSFFFFFCFNACIKAYPIIIIFNITKMSKYFLSIWHTSSF